MSECQTKAGNQEFQSLKGIEKLEKLFYYVSLNSFSAGLWPANLAPAPGQICKQTLSYHKTRKKSFFRLVFGVIRIIFHRRNFWAQKMFHTTISSARARVRKKRSIRETTSLVAQIKHGYDVILRRWRRRS